jgi:hypothetical protein
MKPDACDADLCTWRDLRVVNLKSGRAPTAAKSHAVLVYWRDHGEPPVGYNVEWPAGKKRVSMVGLGDDE